MELQLPGGRRPTACLVPDGVQHPPPFIVAIGRKSVKNHSDRPQTADYCAFASFSAPTAAGCAIFYAVKVARRRGRRPPAVAAGVSLPTGRALQSKSAPAKQAHRKDPPLMEIKNKVALVTGAGSGI